MFYFDKFGESHFEEFITKAFLWAYRTRVESQRITFKTIENKVHDKVHDKAHDKAHDKVHDKSS